MARGERPVTYRELTWALRQLGFEPKPRTGTSHEKWSRPADGRMVVVDEPKSPFHRSLLMLMLRQMGVTKREFFEMLRAK